VKADDTAGETERPSLVDAAGALPAFEPGAPAGTIGLLRAMRSNLLAAFDERAYSERRGSFRLLGRRYFYLNDPAEVGHVLNAHQDRYQPHLLAKRLLEPVLGRGLLLAEGDGWRRQHRLLAPIFQPRHVERLIGTFHETAARRLASWSRAAESWRNLLVDFRDLTLAMMARAMLSLEDDANTAELARFAGESDGSASLLKWQDYVAAFCGIDFGIPSERRALAQRWRGWVRSLLARRPPIDDADQARDLLDLLRTARDEAGVPLSQEEIVDQVGTILAAGFATTSLSLFWTALMLAAFPAQQELVREELCLGSASAPPESHILRSSRRAVAFLYETLRLYPPSYIIARAARQDDRIGNLAIPRGAAVLILPWLLHRHSAHWEEPHRFLPERFLSAGRIVTPPAWIPFGAGPRVCIGATFATTEILVVLRCILARYRLGLHGPLPRPTGKVGLSPEFEPRFTLTPL
jgi:cytochrome P450